MFLEISVKSIYNVVEDLKILTQLIYIKKTGVIPSETFNAKLKDENDFEIKLTDYGLAKSYQNNSNSKYSNYVGTDYYRAPEVFKNKGCSKSDLWSIGIILYYLYHLEFPFKDLEEYINSDKEIKIEKSEFEIFDDLLYKLLVKDFKERIN